MVQTLIEAIMGGLEALFWPKSANSRRLNIALMSLWIGFICLVTYLLIQLAGWLGLWDPFTVFFQQGAAE